MDLEFHYHVTALVARHAGFTEAEATVVGHAAQMVDDNHAARLVLDARARPVFRSLPTQARGLLGAWSVMRAVYPAFHFVPGRARDMAPRVDGAVHPLVTTPDSPGARALLSAAFLAHPETRLMRVGIASHAYADTWAHQGFAGLRHPINALGRGVLPALGHAAALARPDRVGLRWSDPRLADPRIDNGARFLAAARGLFARYREHLKGHPNQRAAPAWEALGGALADILAADGPVRGRGARMAAYARLAPWLPPYDALEWERAALAPWEDAVHEGQVADGPRRAPAPIARLFAWRTHEPAATAWRRFQEAARDHLCLGLRLFAPELAEAGLPTDVREVLPDPAPPPAPEPGLDLADLWAAAGDAEGAPDGADTDFLPLAGVRSEG